MRHKKEGGFKGKKRLSILLFLFVFIFFALMLFSFGISDKNSFTGFAVFKKIIFNSFERIISAGRIFINILFIVNIHSPQNTTYNFEGGGNYVISLNVSSNRNISYWNYTLKDLRHGIIVNYSTGFTPNTTINSVRWSNELIVYATDFAGNIKNSSVVFNVNVSNSAPIIGNISDRIYVCETNSLLYIFNVTDSDEDNITPSLSPQYPNAPFYIAYSSSPNLTVSSHQIYSGIFSKTDAGGVNNGSKNYSENISVNDGINTDTKNLNITIIEVNNAPTILNIGVKTIWTIGDNRSFNYQVQVADIEDGNQDSGNLSFNMTGTSLFNISSNGTMNFTANSSHLGIYNISVCVTDNGIKNPHQNISLCSQAGANRTSCNNFSLTVTNQNRPPRIISYYPSNKVFNVSEGASVYFNMVGYDPDGTLPDAYWYVDNVFKEYDAANSNSTYEFTYDFDYNSAGNHTIIGKITDGILNESYDYIQWNITVLDVPATIPSPEGIGGGGGGGVAKAKCSEKWGCSEWNQCENLKINYESGKINRTLKSKLEKNCSLLKWNEEFCGFQARECKDLNFCNTTLIKPFVIKECYYTEKPTCSDGIKNCHKGSCETLVDCGGPCSACPTCSDKIKNQNEKDIDCGGACPPCRKELPISPKTKKLIGYIFLISLILALIIIIALTIRYYITERKLEKIEENRRANRFK